MRIENVCLSCEKDSNSCRINEHPLFKGGICDKCQVCPLLLSSTSPSAPSLSALLCYKCQVSLFLSSTSLLAPLVVVYIPALKLFKTKSLEEVLRTLKNSSRLLEECFKNSSGILEEFFKNFQGREIDSYHPFFICPLYVCLLSACPLFACLHSTLLIFLFLSLPHFSISFHLCLCLIAMPLVSLHLLPPHLLSSPSASLCFQYAASWLLTSPICSVLMDLFWAGNESELWTIYLWFLQV